MHYLLLCKKANYVINTQTIIRLHSQQALVVHLEVMEGKQHHCTAAKFVVLCEYHEHQLTLETYFWTKLQYN